MVAKVKKNCKVHYGASHTTMSGCYDQTRVGLLYCS